MCNYNIVISYVLRVLFYIKACFVGGWVWNFLWLFWKEQQDVSKSYFMELLRIFILLGGHAEWWNTNRTIKWKVRVLSHLARCSMFLECLILFQSHRKDTFKCGMEVTKIITLPALKANYPEFFMSRNLS